MGGPGPIGYDVIDRKLAINPAEADMVRLIFTRCLKAQSYACTVLTARSARSAIVTMSAVRGTIGMAGAFLLETSRLWSSRPWRAFLPIQSGSIANWVRSD